MKISFLKSSMIIVIAICFSCKHSGEKKNTQEIGEQLDFSKLISKVPLHAVLKNPDYYIWGASMVQGNDKRYHLYYSRWPKAKEFRGWLDFSEIAYATSDSPDGPYTHEKVVLKGFGKGHWNEQSAHNPHIKKFGDKYYLYFVSHINNDFGKKNEMENHRWGQRIGLAISDTPSGPWKVSQAPLIEYQQGKGAEGYMVNPSVCQKSDGTYLMIFKTRSNLTGLKDRMIQCMATAPSPNGPFTISEKPILTEKEVEDPFLWFQDGKYYTVLDDQRGLYTGFHGLALFTSMDGERWEVAKNPNVTKPEIRWENGTIDQLKYLERPQIWFNKEGRPAMLFCAVQLKKGRDSINLPFNVHIPLKSMENNK